MQSVELSLGAALRDVTARRTTAVDKAVASLAQAMLTELSRPGPAWRAADDHERGSEVVAAFRTFITDEEAPPPRRGMAAIGLGTIGEPALLDLVQGWLKREGDAPDAVFLRECALISISFVGTAAPRDAPERERALRLIRKAMKSDLPDMRFQAALALVEVAGNDADDDLRNALAAETHTAVRESIVEAIGLLSPPSAATCRALQAVVDSEDGTHGVGFDAAMALADARKASARPRLLDALAVRAHRDRALEALAALGKAESADCERVWAIARRWWLPAVTRVRAAYALVRMMGPGNDAEARAMLDRFTWHPRPAVREAVTDARAALAKLGTPATP